MKYMLMSYETQEDFAARTDEGRKELYWTVDVPDSGQAIEWAERAPAFGSGAVEIRPVW